MFILPFILFSIAFIYTLQDGVLWFLHTYETVASASIVLSVTSSRDLLVLILRCVL